MSAVNSRLIKVTHWKFILHFWYPQHILYVNEPFPTAGGFDHRAIPIWGVVLQVCFELL